MTLSALAEPNRLRIIELLRKDPLSVGEIAERLFLRQPQVSKHLKVLNEAGLVGVMPKAQLRIYQLETKPFKELDLWLEPFRDLWENRYEELDVLLEEMKADAKKTGM
ncbi:ArsR/SmtB family transcription factor [Leptospira idonii]|uniref:ArsR family transcriptional regulator n=1 Tax=Leptospira idonii TaxID=1193500 RepID=A0A4V3JY55_9LEPT|nr:metalloregulator ArsR/SmtB family transcription factor [Leptospira idonii]TGN19906.1 ArsR family transcriptional regulator [Leptospira idonii]